MTVNEARVRRPAQHEVLIQQLREEGGFPTMRDVLLFAAGLGVSTNRRIPFDRAGESIRYETVTAEVFSETFISMIAASVTQEDPEILDGSRLAERIQIFEEYSNGGLEYLQEQINVRRQSLEIVVRSLVANALAGAGQVDPVSVEELLRAL